MIGTSSLILIRTLVIQYACRADMRCSTVRAVRQPCFRLVQKSVDSIKSTEAGIVCPVIIFLKRIPLCGGIGERIMPVLRPDCSPWPYRTTLRHSVRCRKRPKAGSGAESCHQAPVDVTLSCGESEGKTTP